MRTKMKKLICVRETKVRGRLRTSCVWHGAYVSPPRRGCCQVSPRHRVPGLAGIQPRTGSLTHSPGYTASWISAGITLLLA